MRAVTKNGGIKKRREKGLRWSHIATWFPHDLAHCCKADYTSLNDKKQKQSWREANLEGEIIACGIQW